MKQKIPSDKINSEGTFLENTGYRNMMMLKYGDVEVINNFE
ncbi:hypothetical protein [Brassicibacter mesophilus]